MRTVVFFLPAVICVGGMALCVRLMTRKHGGSRPAGQSPHRLDESEIVDLQRELDLLRDEVASRDARSAPPTPPTDPASPKALSRK